MELTASMVAGGVLVLGGLLGLSVGYVARKRNHHRYGGDGWFEDRSDGSRGAVAVVELPTVDAT